MANNTHPASSVERRGLKLATLFLRAKKSYGQLTARSTSWAQSQGWPAWVSKVPIIAVGTLLLAVSLFSIIALAAVAILGMAFLLFMGKMHESIQADPESSILKNNDGAEKEGHAGYGYYVNGTCNYYPDDET